MLFRVLLLIIFLQHAAAKFAYRDIEQFCSFGFRNCTFR